MKAVYRLSILSFALVMALSTTVFAETFFSSADTVISMLELTFSAMECDYDISGNSSGFVIRFSNEEYSQMYWMAMLFGNNDIYALMQDVANSTAELNAELRELVESCGISNPNLTLMLTDHEEKDCIFLITCNGQLVYDMLAD